MPIICIIKAYFAYLHKKHFIPGMSRINLTESCFPFFPLNGPGPLPEDRRRLKYGNPKGRA
jgi:hypothetical protein